MISVLAISMAPVWCLIMPSRKIRCRHENSPSRIAAFHSHPACRPGRRDVCPLKLTTAHRLEPTVHGVDLRQLRVLDVAGQSSHLRMNLRLASSRSLIETASSWCGSINWTNMMSVLFEGAGAGNGRGAGRAMHHRNSCHTAIVRAAGQDHDGSRGGDQARLEIVISYQLQVFDGMW